MICNLPRLVNFRNQRQITNPGEQVQTRPGLRRATSSANRLFPPARDAYSLSAFHLISLYCRILTSYRGFTNQKCQLYRNISRDGNTVKLNLLYLPIMLSQAHNSFIIGGGKEQPTDLHPCLNIVCETVPREMRAAPSLRFCPPPLRPNGRNSQFTQLMNKNKLNYEAPEVEIMEIIPETAILSGSAEQPDSEYWF